jgi:hypothetical protein
LILAYPAVWSPDGEVKKAQGEEGRIRMIRLIAAAGFVIAVATSAQAITPAPITQSDGMITQVRFACGPGRTLVAGRCVARTTIRHTRRVIRRY